MGMESLTFLGSYPENLYSCTLKSFKISILPFHYLIASASSDLLSAHNFTQI